MTSLTTSRPDTITFSGPPHPLAPGETLRPFVAELRPTAAERLPAGAQRDYDIEATTVEIHPDLPPVPIWGYGRRGRVSSPGPLIEVAAGQPVEVRWHNRLAMPTLPFVTSRVTGDNDADSSQNRLGRDGGAPQDLSGAPIGYTVTHLHGGHTRPDYDGWPDNMIPAPELQLTRYENTYDNADLGLTKVGQHLWYHDHAMNGTRYHAYAGLLGNYLIRDHRERELGLPTSVDDGEIALTVNDRNLDATDGTLRILHKVTDTAGEFFGPLTLVNSKLWPRLRLTPQVFRLRVLNASNSRFYRLHLLDSDGQPAHSRVLVIGADGGLLWRPAKLADHDGITLAPAERIDLLVDLTGLDGSHLYLVNSATASFSGEPPPSNPAAPDLPGRNPFPQVMRLDVREDAAVTGAPRSLFNKLAGRILNPAFRRLVHDAGQPAPGSPPQLELKRHEHRLILLAETSNPPGHLFLQEVMPDPHGKISIQLPHDTATQTYSVIGSTFYDQVGIMPALGQWEIWRFLNTTGDTHPMHIHQANFQPLSAAGALLRVTDDQGNALYDPLSRTTQAPLTPDPSGPGRAYEPQEVGGWKDTIRVDPGNLVEVAIRFDLPGRYVYHCHMLEHEDHEMMRPFVVTVGMGMGHMDPMSPNDMTGM